MRKSRLVFFLQALFITLISNVSATSDGNPDDEYVWSVKRFDASTVIASTPGITMHGDKLRIRLVKGGCDYGQLWTSVYTIPSEGVDETTFINKNVSARFMGQQMTFPVMYAGKFILGYLVMLDMGVYDLGQLGEILSRKPELKMEYLDSADFKSTEFFDIPSNSWSTKNLTQAIQEASSQCHQLEIKTS